MKIGISSHLAVGGGWAEGGGVEEVEGGGGGAHTRLPVLRIRPGQGIPAGEPCGLGSRTGIYLRGRRGST